MLIPELTEADLVTIKEKIEDGIEQLSIDTHPSEFRNHLGMSEIGKPCSRQIYYKFRWMFQQYFDGRMRRLFARGHREEARWTGYLRSIGCTVEQHDENGKQFRASGVLGHYGGSCDGRVITPWYSDKFLVEFKTHNSNSFSKIVNDGGVKKHKPEHYDQMCSYGWKMGLQYAIYFPENKNDDDIQIQVLKLDWNRGQQLEKKAAEIILAKEPPPKISENPAFQECKWCDAKGICHGGEVPLKNCRSCQMSRPVEDAKWHCARFDTIIPADWLSQGCDKWIPI